MFSFVFNNNGLHKYAEGINTNCLIGHEDEILLLCFDPEDYFIFIWILTEALLHLAYRVREPETIGHYVSDGYESVEEKIFASLRAFV